MSWETGCNYWYPADSSVDGQGRSHTYSLSWAQIHQNSTAWAPSSFLAPCRAEGIPGNWDCPYGVFLPIGSHSGGGGGPGVVRQEPHGCPGTPAQPGLSGRVCHRAECLLMAETDSHRLGMLGSSGLHPSAGLQTVYLHCSPGHPTPKGQGQPCPAPLPSLPSIPLPFWTCSHSVSASLSLFLLCSVSLCVSLSLSGLCLFLTTAQRRDPLLPGVFLPSVPGPILEPRRRTGRQAAGPERPGSRRGVAGWGPAPPPPRTGHAPVASI